VTTGSGDSPGVPSRAFRERARLEADRYGPDPWVFVRELLQNARDAGARRVRFFVFGHDRAGAYETVVCQDDGEGMTFDHARRYLFALYASSKEGQKNQAGKFGVGFWSVLRFEPVTIVVRSRPGRGAAWGVSLDGSLENATPVAAPDEPGTEIILRRPRGDGGLEHRVQDAVWQSARYLSRRDQPESSLDIEINGHRVNGEFALPAPSASFRRRKVRGVVALGSTPRVELFCRGLRVRSASYLGDLLAPGGRHSGWMRVEFSELPGGLAPQALLESAELEIMLSRADVRDTRALARLVRLAQRELERLIERQLAVARPLPWWRRVRNWLGGLPLGPTAAVAGLGLLLAVLLSGGWRGSSAPGKSPPPAPLAGELPAARPFEDLGGRYRGPQVDAMGPSAAEPIDLRYRPASRRPYVAALSFAHLAADGSPVRAAVAQVAHPYAGASGQGRSCLEVELPLQASATVVRIPVPTGHRVVTGSVSMEGRPPRLGATADGQPVLVFAAPARGLLRYRTVAAPDPDPPLLPRPPPSLPAELLRRARALRALPVTRRVNALLALVRQRVAYDESPATVALHRAAIGRGDGFIARTLAIGAGDCDVQNGLLTALLHGAGVPARLAVGYKGENGRVLPWLHAWVEYRDGRGWLVADATESAEDTPPRNEGQRVARAALPNDAPAESPPRPTAVVAGLAPPTRPAEKPPNTWPLFFSPLLLVAGGWFVFATRTHRAFKLEANADVSKLLRSALQEPEAFGHIGALMHRPLVPLASGTAISLTRAGQLARRARLFSTRERPALARAALRAGAAVIDARTDEGKTVADALGAVDLDEWATTMERSTQDPLLREVNRILRRQGEEWAVRASPTVPSAVAAIDLAPLGTRMPGMHGTRLVMVDDHADWLAEARLHHQVRPPAAAFMVVDQLARRLDLPEPRRTQLLAAAARQAIMASFGEP
jgi:transglutaminase-like putative cysteine protease